MTNIALIKRALYNIDHPRPIAKRRQVRDIMVHESFIIRDERKKPAVGVKVSIYELRYDWNNPDQVASLKLKVDRLLTPEEYDKLLRSAIKDV